ncbi:PREDICTED: uncharacterized protein LOC106125851 [Papilio xuthus]|uniref:Uncharacterized protein LOC106125851 n=1 Tax=Papilio xuthus TaxID=66420 RepID=A0AAJ6ZT37_PAPXU|nr:PREDICTED: uncharacterized protein LOC106125851 [Papilio xuthus]
MKSKPWAIRRSVSNGTSYKKIDDADLQSDYMPQQLNAAFVSKDEPWKAIMPMKQVDTSLSNALSTYTALTIKYYSRMIACAVLALSSIIEISVYLVELYIT